MKLFFDTFGQDVFSNPLRLPLIFDNSYVRTYNTRHHRFTILEAFLRPLLRCDTRSGQSTLELDTILRDLSIHTFQSNPIQSRETKHGRERERERSQRKKEKSFGEGRGIKPYHRAGPTTVTTNPSFFFWFGMEWMSLGGYGGGVGRTELG